MTHSCPTRRSADSGSAMRAGATSRCSKVTRVVLSARPFGVWVGDPDAAEPTYRARSVIVSTGAQSLMLGLENEGRLIGHGVSTSATREGFFFRDHPIAVVGAEIGRASCRERVSTCTSR